jgi:hypothetical protein
MSSENNGVVMAVLAAGTVFSEVSAMGIEASFARVICTNRSWTLTP